MGRKLWLSLVIVLGMITVSSYAEPLHTYIDLGLGGYYLQQSRFSVGTSDYTVVPLVNFRLQQLVPSYHLGIGYQFADHTHSIFRKLFGAKHAFTFKFAFLTKSKSNNLANLGNGRIWFIDGSGSLFDGAVASNIKQVRVTGKQQRYDLGVYFKGWKYLTGNKLYLNPYLGLVFSHLYLQNEYTAVYDADFLTDTDIENYRTRVDYFGLALGNCFNYQINQHFTAFADLAGQLLHADSRLDAYQNPAVNMNAHGSPPPSLQPRSVSADKDIGVTYRAILALGASYQLLHFYHHPITATLEGGVDLWGYVPQVITPKAKTDGPVRLGSKTSLNSFITLGVQVPII